METASTAKAGALEADAPKRMTLVLATKNPGKLAELRALFAPLPVELVAVDEAGVSFASPIESGNTFEANAIIKARAAAEATMLVAIADDSGLEVDALGGRPGVRSARFAGDNATDAENNAALLTALDEVEDAGRTARFRCVIAVVDPYADTEQPILSEGRCEGLITRTSRGESGFGYDPLFVVTGVGRTFAELDDTEKNSLSHRAKAVRALLPQVEALVRARLADAQRVLGGEKLESPASRRKP
ncbi:MAG: RdgB/HAM1 family non-canonical purine NTP pyrophosphatase [Polyangiaceae bacterium]